jgi:hypothetical protein
MQWLKKRETYNGNWINDQIIGYGKFKWGTGESYTGYLVKGLMHGKGKYYFKNGSFYSGNFKDG